MFVAVRSGEAAAQVDLSFIEQSSEADGQGGFVAGKTALLNGHPGDLLLRDHPAGNGLQENGSQAHERDVTDLLHHASFAGLVAPPGRAIKP